MTFLCGQGGIRTPEGESQLVYSQSHLTALEPTHRLLIQYSTIKNVCKGLECEDRMTPIATVSPAEATSRLENEAPLFQG